jgi:hypothetical protein
MVRKQLIICCTLNEDDNRNGYHKFANRMFHAGLVKVIDGFSPEFRSKEEVCFISEFFYKRFIPLHLLQIAVGGDAQQQPEGRSGWERRTPTKA